MSDTPLDLDALQALCDAATRGPWEVYQERGVITDAGTKQFGADYQPPLITWLRTTWIHGQLDDYAPIVCVGSGPFYEPQHIPVFLNDADPPFIAASRTAMPALLARLRESEARVRELEAALKPRRMTRPVIPIGAGEED